MIHLRPEKERVTLSAAGTHLRRDQGACPRMWRALTQRTVRVPERIKDARRGHELAMPMDTLQHRTVGGRRWRRTRHRPGKIGQFVLAIEIRNAEAGCA